MILDCTIRDGGYYNKWDFNLDLVSKYLSQINDSNIDYVEIGYRSLKNDKYYGPFYYCTENFLSSLNIPKKLNIAVMLNAVEIEYYQNLNQDLIDNLFEDKKNSLVSLVRIASNLDSVINIIPAINNLKKKGYKVSLNLMKVTNISDEELILIMETLIKECAVDIFCIADSYGNISQSTLVEKIKILKAVWNTEIGVHLHNNQGRACSSAIVAYNHGVDWIDTTVLGMGRGAGNASTERLMLDINESNTLAENKYMPEKLFGIVLNEFSELKKKYEWGYNLLYEISSRYALHPNHVMDLMSSKNRYSPDQMLGSLYKLIEQHANIDLKDEVKSQDTHFKSLLNAKNTFSNRTVLLLGPGNEASKHSEQLKNFINTYNPLVISLNTVRYIPIKLVDIIIFLNEFRVIAEIDQIDQWKGKIILPTNLINHEILNNIDNNKIINHQVKIERNKFLSHESKSTIPYEIVFAYAFTALLLGSPRMIYLFGFDGFLEEDFKQNQMLEIFKLIDESNNLSIPICSLTNSSYPIHHKSIYGPNL